MLELLRSPAPGYSGFHYAFSKGELMETLWASGACGVKFRIGDCVVYMRSRAILEFPPDPLTLPCRLLTAQRALSVIRLVST